MSRNALKICKERDDNEFCRHSHDRYKMSTITWSLHAYIRVNKPLKWNEQLIKGNNNAFKYAKKLCYITYIEKVIRVGLVYKQNLA